MTTKPAKSIVPITVIALFAVFGISVATGFIMNAGFSAFSSKVTPTGTPTGFGSLSTPDDPSAAVGNRSTDGCRITSANQLKLRVPATNSTPTGAARKLFLGATALMSTTDEASDQGPFSNTASPGTHSSNSNGLNYSIVNTLGTYWTASSNSVQCPQPTGSYSAELPTPTWRWRLDGDTTGDTKNADNSYPAFGGTVIYQNSLPSACTNPCTAVGSTTLSQPPARYGATGTDSYSATLGSTSASPNQLTATYNNSTTGAGYKYSNFAGISNLTLPANSNLVYDVKNITNNPEIAIDLGTTTNNNLHSTAISDQNNLAATPSTNIDEYASSVWYTRMITLDSWAGQTVNRYSIGSEKDNVVSDAQATFRNIRIEDSNGVVLRWIYQKDFVLSNHSSSPNASATYEETVNAGTSTPGHIKTTGTNSAINGNSTWTAAAYINPEAALRSSALSTNHFIISAIDEDSAQKGWYVYLDSTGHVVAGMSAGGLATWYCTTDLSIAEVVGLTRPYDSTSWLHVAAVYNNSSSSAIYINGYVVPCTASGSYDNVASQQNLGNSGTITLGQSAGTVPFSFYGSIDDTYVNTSALTASSVAALVCPAPSLSTAVLVRDNCMGVTTTPLGSDSLNFLAVQGSGAAWPNIPSPAFSANSGVREAQLSRNNLIDSGFNSVGNDSSSPARRSLVSTEQGTNASSLGSSSFSLALWVRGLSPTYINSNPPTFLKSRSWTLAASSDGTNDTNDKLKLVIAGAEGSETYITTSSVPLYAASDLSDAAGYSNRAHMIAATYNDSDNTVCFYFDGALVEACKPDASLTRLPSYYQTFLSVASDALGATYTMTLDDIFGYSAVLSKNSIERLWLSAVPEGNILP